MTEFLKKLSIGVLTLMTLIIVPPMGIVVLEILVHNIPSIQHTFFQIKVSLQNVASSVGLFFISKLQQPKTFICIVMFIFTEVIALYFLYLHLQILETDDYLLYVLKQMGLTGLLLVSMLGLAWVVFSLEKLFESLFAKVVTSLAISGCIILARLFAIDFFSSYFPFPPSYMPTSFAIGTIILAFSFTAFIFAALAVIFEIGMPLFLPRLEKNELVVFTVILVCGAGFLGAATAGIAVLQGIQPKGRLLMIKLAEKYDFTTNHMCEAGKEESVLFIENVADRAIAATFPKQNKTPARLVTNDDFRNSIPRNFHMVRCNPMPAIKNAR